MLHPQTYNMFSSFPAAEPIQSQVTFALQTNRATKHMEVDRDHLSQTLLGPIVLVST